MCECVCCTQGICRGMIVAAHDDCEEVIMSQRFEGGGKVRHQCMTWGVQRVILHTCVCVCVWSQVDVMFPLWCMVATVLLLVYASFLNLYS